MKRISIIKSTMFKYIENNSKEYILALIIFVIGIFIRCNVYK